MLWFGFCCLMFLHTGTADNKERIAPAALPECSMCCLLHFPSMPSTGREYREIQFKNNSNCKLK